MTQTAIILGCLFAVYLTLADIASTEARKTFGRRNGLLCWILSVAAPIVAVLVVATKVALLAMVVSTVLSFIAYRKRMRDLNKGSSDDPEPCSDF